MSDSEYLINLGKKIKELRVAKGISQIELAHACDYEKSSMSRIEAGRTNPTTLTLLKISKALDVNVCDLLPEEPL